MQCHRSTCKPLYGALYRNAMLRGECPLRWDPRHSVYFRTLPGFLGSYEGLHRIITDQRWTMLPLNVSRRNSYLRYLIMSCYVYLCVEVCMGHGYNIHPLLLIISARSGHHGAAGSLGGGGGREEEEEEGEEEEQGRRN